MKNDILNSFNRLMCHTFCRHRGFLLERSGYGFTYRDRFFANLQEVDEYINSRFEALGQSYQKSLNKLKNEHQEKTTSQKTQPIPKYKNRQRVYFISYHNGKPEYVNEVEILSRNIREYSVTDSLGKPSGTVTAISYSIIDYDQRERNLMESELFPSFFEAAKVFAKGFLFLLK